MSNEHFPKVLGPRFHILSMAESEFFKIAERRSNRSGKVNFVSLHCRERGAREILKSSSYT